MCHVAFSFSTQNSLQYAVGLPDSCRNLVLGKPSNVCSVRKILAIVNMIWSSASNFCTSWTTTCQVVLCIQSVFLFPGIRYDDTLKPKPFCKHRWIHGPRHIRKSIHSLVLKTSTHHFTIRKNSQIFYIFQNCHAAGCSSKATIASTFGEQKALPGNGRTGTDPLGFPSWRFWTWDETYSEFAPMKRWQNWGEVSFSKQQFSGVMWWLFQSYLECA